MKRTQPNTPDEWLDEIQLAIADARETEPFANLIGESITDANLFHLAPLVCMKFRGWDFRDKILHKKVTEGALANYVVNSDPDGSDHGLESRPLLSFTLCYMAAHYVLDLIDKQEAECVLNYCEENMGGPMTEPHRIWTKQCEAARGIEDEFGTQNALEYLVGEKFLNFLEAVETDAEFRAEIPAFVAEVKSIFERWQLAQYLEIARETEPFDSALFEDQDEIDAEEVEDMRQDDIRRCTRDLLLVERAREWLLEGESK